MSGVLKLGSEGDLVALGQRDELKLWRLGPDAAPGRLPEPMRLLRGSWHALAVVGDEVWLLDGPGLVRVAVDGAPREPLPLALPRAGCRFTAEVGGAGQTPQVGLLGTDADGGAGVLALSLDCGELVIERLQLPEAPPTAAAPLGGGAWLVVLGRSLAVVRGGELVLLEAAPLLCDGAEVIDAVALWPGAAALVVLEGGGAQQSIHVIDSRTGEVKRRIAAGDAGTRVRIAGRRGQALLATGASLELVDLRFGRTLARATDVVPLLDAAIDTAGQRIALVRETSSGPEVGWLPARALYRHGPRAAELWPDQRPLSALPIIRPQSEPEPPAAPTARGTDPAIRIDALATEPATGIDDLGADPAMRIDDLATDEPPPLEVSPDPPLGAFLPRSTTTVARGPDALRYLEHHLALVGAWAKRAVCAGWDSGRIAFAAHGTRPFAHEVAALVDGAAGGAPAELAQARAQAAGLEVVHDRAQGTQGELPPLAALAREFHLTPVACDILLVAAAPAIWGELARLYAIVANDRERHTCDEWLITTLLGERAGRRDVARELDPDAPLLRHGLVRVGAGMRPFAALTAHPLVVERLYGEDFAANAGEPGLRPRDPDRPLARLQLGMDASALLARLARPLRQPVRMVVRGGTGSGRTSLLAALAARAGRRLGVIDVGALARSGAALDEALADALCRAVLRGWLPCVSGAEALPSDTADRVRDVVRAHGGPLTFRAARDADLPIDPGYFLIELPALDEGARASVWHRALTTRGLDGGLADGLAARYLVGPGVVERVTAEVAAAACSDQLAALDAALRQHRDAHMGSIATRVTRLATWSQVVLPPDVVDSVREFVGRVRHRRTVFERWGMDRVMTSSRGLTALFAGGPGTGKTMVAGIIARELGCDLYRVDLSRVLSKWVGETERNLGALFDAAEDGQAILLFDEADALFARRTEVKSSNDRFANIEVNYLLQRLDAFAGIAILTTNLGGSIDPAFKRRLTLRLTFPFPDEDARTELWRAHLPPELPSAGELDLAGLARRYPLSGGYIRNIALRAAFLAAHEARRLTRDHLERAVALEYREMGKLVASGTLE